MSFNIYEYEEDKTPAYEEQFENFQGDYHQLLDLYNTGCQFQISSKSSHNKPHTGSSKNIRKIKLIKKQKSNQYTPEEQNYIIRKIASVDGVTNNNKQNNKKSLLQQKDINKIIKQMKQLNLH